MLPFHWRELLAIIGFYVVVAPLVVKVTFRFQARCQPVLLPAEGLPITIARLFNELIPKLQGLGFELIGCYDCGVLASNTRSYIAYFCNRTTNDFANISAVLAPNRAAGYFEFSTRFSNGMFLETNTNRTLPLTPPRPEVRTFRFPEISDPNSLYRVHRRLIEKYAAGLRAQGEPKGEEIQRLVRVVESYGPRSAEIGYMYLAADGTSYRLTWKGCYLMTWRALWPLSLVRRLLYRQAMQAELRSLDLTGLAALQRA